MSAISPAPPASRSWGLRAAALSGVRAALAAGAPVDVLHVRMADVGSWAAAQVAREQGIPLVLTLAPDPHAPAAHAAAMSAFSVTVSPRSVSTIARVGPTPVSTSAS